MAYWLPTNQHIWNKQMLSCVSISLLNIERSRNITAIENFQNPKNYMFPCGIIRYDEISNMWFNIISWKNNCKDSWRSHKHIHWVYKWNCMLRMWTSFTDLLTSWLTSMAMQLVVDLLTTSWFLVFYYICPNFPTFLRM